MVALGACGVCNATMELQVERGGKDKEIEFRYAVCAECALRLRLPRGDRYCATGERCPLCRFEVLQVERSPAAVASSSASSNSGASTAPFFFAVCVKCFSSPPVQGPCSACSQTDCKFYVRKSVRVASCPKCGSPLSLKKKKDAAQSYVICTAYPSCKVSLWFPESVVDVQPLGTCPRCVPEAVRLKCILSNDSSQELCLGGCLQVHQHPLFLQNPKAADFCRTKNNTPASTNMKKY